MDESTAPEGGVEAEPLTEEAEAPAKEVEEKPEGEAPGKTEDNEESEGEDGEDTDEEIEEIEFNFGGNQLRVPKDAIPEELASKVDEFTRGTWSDYTRKSQEVAEKTKQVEARESAVNMLSTMHGEALDSYSQGLRLRDDIQQLSGIDLGALWQSDPDQARRVSDAISQKQAEFSNVVARVQQQEQALGQAQDEESAKRIAAGKVQIEQRIRGFEAKAPEVIDYVTTNYGIDTKSAENWGANPAGAIMAYKAMLYDRMQAKAKPKATKPSAPNPVKPLKGKGGKSSKNPDDMTTDEWVNWRENQIRRKSA